MKVRITSGRISYSNQDTIIRLFDLEPYNAYFIDLSQNSFESIGWQIKKKTMNVTADPNCFKVIEVPVAVKAEGAGSVYLDNGGVPKGQSRINVCFYREDGTPVQCTATDPEGYFSYLGLDPGTYTVHPDKGQLEKLHMNATPESRTITILPSKEGALIDGLDFTLKVSDK